MRWMLLLLVVAQPAFESACADGSQPRTEARGSAEKVTTIDEQSSDEQNRPVTLRVAGRERLRVVRPVTTTMRVAVPSALRTGQVRVALGGDCHASVGGRRTATADVPPEGVVRFALRVSRPRGIHRCYVEADALVPGRPETGQALMIEVSG